MPRCMKHTLHCLCTVGGRLHNTQKAKKREISSSIPRQKQHYAQIPKGFIFPFHLGRRAWIYLGFPPIWCTFTVSQNEFCFQYMCQIKTSGRKKNLHFEKPHVSSHFWHCRTQHKSIQTNQDSRYKLFHRIYILKGQVQILQNEQNRF